MPKSYKSLLSSRATRARTARHTSCLAFATLYGDYYKPKTRCSSATLRVWRPVARNARRGVVATRGRALRGRVIHSPITPFLPALTAFMVCAPAFAGRIIYLRSGWPAQPASPHPP